MEFINKIQNFYGTTEPTNLVKCNFYLKNGTIESQIEKKMESLGYSLWDVWGQVEDEKIVYTELLPIC